MASNTRTGEVLPNPDPSVLTTAALIREIEGLRERTGHDNLMLRELIETRLDGNDQAVALLRTTTDKFPAAIICAVKQLQELHEEKFASIQAQVAIQFGAIATQFQERDKRTEQLSLADKTAIAAALQAQKEAAGAQNESNAAANVKMETNFAKLIDQGQALLLEMRRNTEAQINDLKSRLDKGEGRTVAATEVRTDNRSFVSVAIAGAVAFVIVMTAISGVIAFAVTRGAA